MLKSNEYFDGRVKSISLTTEEGPATIGVISPGEYEFTTSQYEYMTVLGATLDLLYPDEEEWFTIGAMETFEVEPDSTFKVKASCDIPYICLYRDTPLPEFAVDMDEDEDEEEDEDCSCHSSCCCK